MYTFSYYFKSKLLTRMKMTWLGDPTTPPSEEYKKTFRTVVTIVICNFIIYSIFYCPVTIPTTVDVAGDSSTIIFVRNDDCPMWKYNLSNAASMIFGLYTFIVMIRLRMTIRSKYNIPENNCLGCEDCCCIFFCGCCSVVQMAHQTANYDEIRAICCNDTGLPPSYNNNISNDKTTLTHAIIV
ncbi:MAG: Cys-rich protein (TIGR01571 family) [Bacillariaceae sp.]|jgi:Cys-rich protein (TIGR01571 family)